MPKKKLQVNLKPIARDIEKVIKTLGGFKSKVSAGRQSKDQSEDQETQGRARRCKIVLHGQEDDSGLLA